MFLLLGLLAFPSRLSTVAWAGLGLAAMLVFVARPLAVFACLLPFRYGLREMTFISWVGLRGAVPIVLATFPVLSGAPGAHGIFDLVFFVVVSSALVQAGTARWLARKLGLLSKEAPPPAGLVEVTSTEVLDGDVLSFAIDAHLPVAGKALAEIDFPPGAAAMLVIRGRSLIAPRGQTIIEPGDHVYVFCRLDDSPRMARIFGKKPD
jgi:cell volume regulation protein A